MEAGSTTEQAAKSNGKATAEATKAAGSPTAARLATRLIWPLGRFTWNHDCPRFVEMFT